MADKLNTLLKTIKLEARFFSFFNDAKLKKIMIDESIKKWHFLIEIDAPLPVSLYNHLNELLKAYFSGLKIIKVTYLPRHPNDDLIKDYYQNFWKLLNKKSLIVFADKQLLVSDKIITIKVLNQTEVNKLNKHLASLKDYFNDVGIDYQLQVIIDDEARMMVKQEIESSLASGLKKKPKPKSVVVLGNEIKHQKITNLKDIIGELNSVLVEVKLFDKSIFESNKNNFKIITLKLTDYSDSLYAKIFINDIDLYKKVNAKLIVGDWFLIEGYVKNDSYSNELTLNVRNIMTISSKDKLVIDDELDRRVELHAHTHMSQMDGLMSATELIERAKKYNHQAIAITDHNSVQAFPEAFYQAKGIKVIYGLEIGMIDDRVEVVFREKDLSLKDATYGVFDVETTGLNALGGDLIIELGAVKLKKGKIIDTFHYLIDPKVKIPKKITDITGITNAMLKGKSSEEEIITKFKEWILDLPLVAHNAKFDLSFLENAYHKYKLGELNNSVIDTLALSRILDSNVSRHGLSYVAKRYNVSFDEESHHRADYDAKATALILVKMIDKLKDNGINNLKDINHLVSKKDVHKFTHPYHLILLAKNNHGLKNMFTLLSLASTKYFYKTARLLRSEIEKYREGLLIGSGCYNGEVFSQAGSKNDQEMNLIISFYDYIEVQPPLNYSPLVQMGEVSNQQEIIERLKRIIHLAKENNKLVVATGDVHHLDDDVKILREIIINQKVPGGGRHPLCRNNITDIPSQPFYNTKEMLNHFTFLDKALAFEIVVTNTNKIAEMIDKVQVIKKGLYIPKIDKAGKIVKELSYQRAHQMYGNPLPNLVQERIDEELKSIIGNGFDVIYLIAYKLVKKSNEDGYIVGSRGSVGSSLIATLLGISEVNPLPPYYNCPNCKRTLFEIRGVSLKNDYASGYDLPKLLCTCGTPMEGDGQDMPFACFLGFNADKTPDIDLNFSSEYQAQAHDYIRSMFKTDKTFRAGTIGTVQERTAYGFVKGYMKEKNLFLRAAEQERLAKGCTGVKRTTGQHPGGIIVIPPDMDVCDFTPYQYPADDVNASWYTTHFDYHAIDDNVVKFDILGKDDPTILKRLEDLTKKSFKDITFDDQKVISLFSSPQALGVTKDQIMCDTGTLGIPEFGTRFVIDMLKETKPEDISDLVRISGLSHGTDVWLGNAQELLRSKTCTFKEVIGCRDDIMLYLTANGLEPLDAFKIMEIVRKTGKSLPSAMIDLMKEKRIPNWYIESCNKIKYMFPKSHATAYVVMAYRIAWYKVYYPIYYYAVYFSIKGFDFDIDSMIAGYEAISKRIIDINNKGYSKTNKEASILDILNIALEMTARGFRFANLDLYKSEAFDFIIASDGKTLIPPFKTIDGLGEIMAKKIVEERDKKPFISIEDLKKRAKVSQTIIEKMNELNMLKGLPESSQLSLFEL